MKKVLLFLFTVLMISASAQITIGGIHISISEKTKEKLEFLQNDQQIPYYYSMPSKTEFKLVKFSDKMLPLSEIVIKLPSSYEKRMIIEQKILGNQLHLFSTHRDKETKQSFFYTESFNLETGESNHDEEMTAKVSHWLYGNMVYSPDGSKFVWFYKPFDNEVSAIYAFVFDENHKLMNDKHRFDFEKYDFSFIGEDYGDYSQRNESFKKAVKLDDNGNIYFLRRVYNKNDIRTRDVTAIVNRSPRIRFEMEDQFYSYILYRAVKENDYKLESYTLKVKPSYFLKKAFLSLIGHDSILISGLYSEKGNLNSAGAFAIIPDFSEVEDEILIQNYKKYPEGFCTKYASEWERGKINKAIENDKVWDYSHYEQVGFVKYKDGYIKFLEQQFYYTISYNSTNHATANQYFDLIGIYVDRDGSVNDIIKVPKRQIAVDRAVASLSIHPLDNEHIQFVFNGVDVWKTSSSNSIISYIMDGDAKLTAYKFPTKKEYPGFFVFSNHWLKRNMLLGAYSKIPQGKKTSRAIISFDINDESR